MKSREEERLEILLEDLVRLQQVSYVWSGQRRRVSRVRLWVIVVTTLLVGMGIFLALTWRSGSGEKEISLQEVISDSQNGRITRLVISPNEVHAEYNDGTIAVSRIYGRVDVATILLSSPTSTTMPEVIFSKPSLFDRFGPTISLFLPAIIVLVGVWLWVRQEKQGGIQQLLSLGKSRARMFTGDKPTVGFDDIGGIEEAVESIDEIVHFLKEPELFISIGARIPKGALLSGPPGCGKTLLAKAVSGEAGVPFFSISASEFIEASMGIGAARVRDLFDQAKRNSPCIRLYRK